MIVRWFRVDGRIAKVSAANEDSVKAIVIALHNRGHKIEASRPPIDSSAPKGYATHSAITKG